MSGFLCGNQERIAEARQCGQRQATRAVEAGRTVTLVANAVSSAFVVNSRDLSAKTRKGAKIARARQVAMYLAHVGLGLSFTDAGRLFGRDRTTAAHACRQVEERRDDPCFDASLEYLEQSLKARAIVSAGAPRH